MCRDIDVKNVEKLFLIKQTHVTIIKKNSETWVKYIELMLQRKTLNECSKELGISLPTAFYWRHKILFSLSKVKEAEKLENNIHISKILIKENFKGERQIRNKERKNVWNVIAMDSEKI